MHRSNQRCCFQILLNGSKVLGCFLDASKAFDKVNHTILFKLLMKRNVLNAVIRLLITWYKEQSLRIRWNKNYSEQFEVSNGVRQGGVLSRSPILFTIYLDELLVKISKLGIRCHFGNNFAGALSYADDIALLAPSPSAMRRLLQEKL